MINKRVRRLIFGSDLEERWWVGFFEDSKREFGFASEIVSNGLLLTLGLADPVEGAQQDMQSC